MALVERQIELRLVARLKDGDAAAFEAIYEAFRPRLFGFLVRLSRRRDVAEDLLEDALEGLEDVEFVRGTSFREYSSKGSGIYGTSTIATTVNAPFRLNGR